MNDSEGLEHRFTGLLHDLELAGRGAHVLVAVSGGCDSVVLLHLLRRAAPNSSLTLTVGHLDHAMRAGSEEDALWLAELCSAWGIPLVHDRLANPPTSEAAARAARYRFLHRAAADVGASVIATAHTADDQAETVLFRAARGTSLKGLAGIPARTRTGIVRPMLTFWRQEVHDYARERGLTWRSDPTNLDLRFARNRIRHRILPELESTFAPTARRRLVGLAEEAAEAEAALARLAHGALRRVARRQGRAWLIDRVRLQEYDPAITTRVLRNVLRRLGPLPGRAGTRAALQFITDASSGREMQLPGGLRIRIEFDEARVERAAAAMPDITVELGPESGERAESMPLRIGGVGYTVQAATEQPPAVRGEDGWTVAVDPSRITFPLQLRGWRPGDRIRTRAGTKPLKKLFLEERIPRSRRSGLPVLTDASGRVLWVAGVKRALLDPPGDGDRTLFLTILND